jgi:hypothetical protein
MTDRVCSYEPVVVRAARAGEWAQSQQAHLRRCATCADSARVAIWLGEVATRLNCYQSTRDPIYIWLRAEIERRAREEDARRLRRIGVAAIQGLAVGGACVAAMFSALPPAAAVSSAVRTWLETALADASIVDMTVIGTLWLGLPFLLAVTYLVALRPLR